MRKLDRPEAPQIFQENAAKWQKQWEHRHSEGKEFTWYQADGVKANKHIEETLVEMTDNHCSFCECYPTDVATIRTIEHFKPKSKFPEKGYDWNNLFLCCTACQLSKLENWEEGLLKPDHPNYQSERFFQFNFDTGKIQPNELASPEDQKVAQTTIDLYKLNKPGYPRERAESLRTWHRANREVAELPNVPFPTFIKAALGIIA